MSLESIRARIAENKLIMDNEFTKWFATLGVGGVLAAFMYTVGRKDNTRHEAVVVQYTELWKAATDRLLNVIEKNTESNVKLIVLIEAAERNQLRKSDIPLLVRGEMIRSINEQSGSK